MNIRFDQNHFLNKGYCILENEDFNSHDKFSNELSTVLGLKTSDFDKLHNHIKYDEINTLRLKAFTKLNSLENKNEAYYSQAKISINSLLGPDISIQNKLNLSIQLPNDKSSILPMHTDTISGQSPFEIVLWIPFTRAYETNSMFILPIDKSKEIMKNINKYSEKGMHELEKDYSKYKKYIDISPNQILIFSPTLFHGNELNQTKHTRISINCRFKNIFSPESQNPERRLGTFYQIFKMSTLTKIALNYQDPLSEEL